MENLFAMPALAGGYATSRPAVHPHVIERVRRRLRLEAPLGRALDVGCGAGLSTRPLAGLARQTFGIEPAAVMLRSSSTVAPEAHFAAARAEELPFRARSMDLIAAAGSLNYAGLDRFFPEAARVLAPGGVLVVYDFSQGRSFRDSPALETWFAEFLRRYPRAPGARPLDPEILAVVADGFTVRDHERFETSLMLEPVFYLAYMMTETNIAHAVHRGEPTEEIRSWCAATLEPVFQGRAQEVLFHGYIAYLVPR